VSSSRVSSSRVSSSRVSSSRVSSSRVHYAQWCNHQGNAQGQGDCGSAIIEFVVLALPLMIPIIIYLGAVQANSALNSDLHNLARQSARAFITSPTESYEYARLQSIVSIFQSHILQPDGISDVPTVTVECSASPCLTPDARVKVTASLTRQRSRFAGIFRFLAAPQVQFSASDTQIVDAWR
jgi:Flp pilus assembly protein TadG